MIHLSHLETNCTIACQNGCASCNHFSPYQKKDFARSYITAAQLEHDLSHLGKVAHVAGYAMIGGEPLLHPHLVDLLTVARDSGIADRLEVWTNGQLLRRAKPDFWRAFDLLVVSVYPGKLTDEDIDWIRAKAADEGLQCDLKDERRFPNFTQLLETVPTGQRETAQKYAACWFRTYSRVLDNGYFYRCCTSPFIPKLLLGLPEGADGIAVEGVTEEALLRFLSQPEAPASCSVCAGRNTPGAVPVTWREESNPEAWLAASSGR